jgi:hypothetical protein
MILDKKKKQNKGKKKLSHVFHSDPKLGSITVGFMILDPLSDPINVLIISLHYSFKVELEKLQLKIVLNCLWTFQV